MILSQMAEDRLMKLAAFRNFFMIAALALLVVMSASFDARGQGRGLSNRDKKCAKFVNCHDASEGRWDGRGPRRETDLRRFRPGRDFDTFGSLHRRRRHHRDFDRDGSWRFRRRDFDRHGTWSRRGR
jgi:hypothetical protein